MSFKQLVRFTNDAGGLEKILRLFQSLSQVLAAWALTSEDAALWLHLRAQFALGRRYIRFFKWMDCFSRAWGCFDGLEGMEMVLGVAKWSFMGLYLGCESLTILDVVGVWPTSWAEKCLLEGNRFWFYSLICSILWGLAQLFAHKEDHVEIRSGEKRDDRTAGRASKSQGVKRRLLSDCFDLLIPGHVTGWIPTSVATTGCASVVSTVLSSKDIWDRMKDDVK